MKQRFYKTAIILACFLAYKYSRNLYILILGKEQWKSWPYQVPATIMLLTGICMACLAVFLLKKRLEAKDLGLAPQGLMKGLLAATVFALPMFLILGFNTNFNFQPNLEILYRGMVLAGFGEELIFRAFLFGLLFFEARWGFLTAGIFTGLFFGAGHLYQAHDLGSAIGIFCFTTGVSLGFAWFYLAWRSLWMVLFLHGFMDLIWDSFAVAGNVTGNFWVNIARVATITFAVIYSIRVAKENGCYDLRAKLWLNREDGEMRGTHLPSRVSEGV